MPVNHAPRVCDACAETYTPTSSPQKRCAACRLSKNDAAKEAHRRVMQDPERARWRRYQNALAARLRRQAKREAKGGQA